MLPGGARVFRTSFSVRPEQAIVSSHPPTSLSGTFACFFLTIINPTPEKDLSTMLEFGGILGLIVLILDIIAIINIFGSSASTGAKVLWTLLILFLPLIGLIIWFFAGPRKAVATV